MTCHAGLAARCATSPTSDGHQRWPTLRQLRLRGYPHVSCMPITRTGDSAGARGSLPVREHVSGAAFRQLHRIPCWSATESSACPAGGTTTWSTRRAGSPENRRAPRFLLVTRCGLTIGAAAADPGQPPVALRCGWFDNPTPGNASPTDRDGQWLIGLQGGHQPTSAGLSARQDADRAPGRLSLLCQHRARHGRWAPRGALRQSEARARNSPRWGEGQSPCGEGAAPREDSRCSNDTHHSTRTLRITRSGDFP